MILDSIHRKDIIDAARQMTLKDRESKAQYYVWLPELNEHYPFKRLFRRAYTLSTKNPAPAELFSSSPYLRAKMAERFGLKITEKTPPFFTSESLTFFKEQGGKTYRKDNSQDKESGEEIYKSIFQLTNFWVNQLEFQECKIEEDNHWQIAGHFTKYSWARIYRSEDEGKMVFFTVGVDAEKECIIYKLDCQHSSYNKDKQLSNQQIKRFKQLVRATDNEARGVITKEHLQEYTWERLIGETQSFINHYLALYDEIIFELWNAGDASLLEQNNFLEMQPIPNGAYEHLPDFKRRVFQQNADYDQENADKKKVGNAGEELVLATECKRLNDANRQDLANAVQKVLDYEGYDILSFNPDGTERYIEVKTTEGSALRGFHLSRNEWNRVKENNPSYFLYRLYHYSKEFNSAKYYVLQGDFSEALLMEPTSYKVTLKKHTDETL